MIIHDRVSRARSARMPLLEALILPPGQVSIEVQLLTLDTDVNYQYGVSLPTAFQLADFGKIGGQSGVLFGIVKRREFCPSAGARRSSAWASRKPLFSAAYTHSYTKTLYDATVIGHRSPTGLASMSETSIQSPNRSIRGFRLRQGPRSTIRSARSHWKIWALS